MFEKVNPNHPDKLADRIAGALVDLAYTKADAPKIAVEVLLGHGKCHIIAETSVSFRIEEVKAIVNRIVGPLDVEFLAVPQDKTLAHNQSEKVRCGDNGIFKGVPMSKEEKGLSAIARDIYSAWPYDGKYIIDQDKLIICQSKAKTSDLLKRYPSAIVNPLGDWTGGINVDSGATNRKLGSDMGQSVTGGGLHGKDLSKADVSINIYVWLKAQEQNKIVEKSCAIGDDSIDGFSYDHIVDVAREYIRKCGGFEKFAEWGLV